MIESRIDHVGLNVQDLDESVEFYQQLFGFEVIEKWDSPRQAFVGRDGVVLGLIEMPDYDYSQFTTAQASITNRHLSSPGGTASEYTQAQRG